MATAGRSDCRSAQPRRFIPHNRSIAPLFRTSCSGSDYIAGDLCPEFFNGRKFLLGAKVALEENFEILVIDLLFEVEQMNFEQAMAAGIGNGGTHTDVGHTLKNFRSAPDFDRINSIGWQLFVVSSQVCGWETNFPSELLAGHDRSQHRKTSAQQSLSVIEISRFKGFPDSGAADRFAIDFDGGHTNFRKAKFVTKSSKQFNGSGAAFAKTPAMADTDFPQAIARGGQTSDEFGRLGIREFTIKMDDEHMFETESSNQAQLVGGRRQDPRRFVGPQNADRVGIKRDDHGGSAGATSAPECALDDRPMTAMHSIENTDRKENRPRHRGQFIDRSQKPVHAPRIRETVGKVKILSLSDEGFPFFSSSTVTA